MKRLNIRTGLPFTALIAVITGFLRLIESASLIVCLALTTYYFIVAMTLWIANNWLIESHWIRGHRYSKFKFYFVSFIFGSVLALFFSYWATRGNVLPVSGPLSLDKGREMLVFFFRGILMNTLNAFVVSHIKQMNDSERRQVELEQMKQAYLQANLSSLKEQLSPHFLFNTFNTLNSLTSEQQVKDYVEQMANVYRYLLDYQKNDLVDLKQELDFVKSYLYIMQVRLESALDVTIGIDPSFYKTKVPPLTLQLLIENAIKHNIASKMKPLRIQLSADRDGLEVRNNLQPKSSIPGTSGLGLTNINQRYQLLFAKEIKIEMEDDFFTVKLPMKI